METSPNARARIATAAPAEMPAAWFGHLGARSLQAPDAFAASALGAMRTDAEPCPVTSAGGPGWRVGAVGAERGMSWFAGGDTVVGISGPVRATEPRLQQAMTELGAACAIAQCWAERGEAMLGLLRGGYALAMLRGGGAELLLAVDRLGIGDVYWAEHDGALTFGTSLPVVRALSGSGLREDPQALFDYLFFHMIPAPATAYREVRRLAPGTYLRRSGARLECLRHSSVHFAGGAGGEDFAALRSEFRELLGGAVGRQVTADGQATGSFLSGGTDSSTVTGCLGQATGAAPRSFSIGFDAEGYDEMEYARLAAGHFGAEHHSYYVRPADIVALLPRLAAFYGQPFGNSSVVPTYYCARLAREHGVARLLAGDGGDELFGGNERYARQRVFSHYQRLPPALRRMLVEPLSAGLAFADRLKVVHKFRRYVEQAAVPLPDRLETYNLVNWFGPRRMFAPDFLASVEPAAPLGLQREVWSGVAAVEELDRMLGYDLRFTLADNDLRKVCGMCDLAGVEVRFPLLDDDVVDFSARLPVGYKLRGTRLRWFFKEALRGFLPEAVITKTKHGFGLPFGTWLLADGELRELVFDALTDFRGRGIIRPDFLDQLTGRWIHDTPNYYATLVWLFVVLELWFRERAA